PHRPRPRRGAADPPARAGAARLALVGRRRGLHVGRDGAVQRAQPAHRTHRAPPGPARRVPRVLTGRVGGGEKEGESVTSAAMSPADGAAEAEAEKAEAAEAASRTRTGTRRRTSAEAVSESEQLLFGGPMRYDQGWAKHELASSEVTFWAVARQMPRFL